MTLSPTSVALVKTKPKSTPLLVVAVALCITSCSQVVDSEDHPKTVDEADARFKRIAEEVERLQQQREQSQAQQDEERQRMEAARLAEAQKPHYSKERLFQAAKQRNWAAITVPDINVKAVFNSNWSQDRLNYRVALLGQQAAIDTFLSGYRAYQINFADQGGNRIFEFDLSPQDFRWAPSTVNNGIPTMESRGSVDCELPRYEQAVQWNLTWSI